MIRHRHRRLGVANGGGGGVSSAVASFTLVNTSGSTQAANFVTPMFGHVFAAGDIPSGQYPQFKPLGGSAVPFTYWGKTTWSDGSWKRAGFMLRWPNAIGGNDTATVNVFNGGSAPSASGFTSSKITAQDLKVVLTGITNLTGTWTSAINQGFTDNDDVQVIGDGDAGIIWRVRQQFMDTGPANHGQLECYHYVAALKDSGGNLYGIRWLPRTVQPWLDIDSPAKNKRGFTATLKNGANTVATPASGSAKSYSATSGNSSITCTGHGYDVGVPVQLSTPPSGFSTSTDYYARVTDSNHFILYGTAGDAVENNSAITPSGNGSGTATPHIEIVHFASFFGANNNRYQYVQGGGSVAAEATVRVVFDQSYWRSTKMVPWYDDGVTPDDITVGAYVGSTPGTYTPNGKCALRFFFDGTGEDITIGTQPSWVAAHFIKQDAVNEDVVRASALAMGGVPLCLKRNSTLTIPVVNAASGTPYSGMGTANPTLRWNQNSAVTSGFTNPSGDLEGCFSAGDSSHWPSAVYYAWLITGEPQYADLLAEVGNFMVICRDPNLRNFTVSSTYRGCCFRDTSQARTDAWGSRELGLAAGSLPDAHWENANIKTYLSDMMQAGYDMMIAYNAAQSSFWTTNGIYHFRTDDASGTCWQHSFMIAVAALVYNVTGYSNALAFLNHLVKFPAAVDADVGIYHYTCFTHQMRQTDSGGGTLVSAMSQIHYSPGGGAGPSWVASSDTWTYAVSSAQFTLANADKLVALLGAPSGASAATAYFLVSTSDPGQESNKTFKISTTSGGSPVNITADGAGEPPYIFLRMANIPATGKGLDYPTDSGYVSIARAAFRDAEIAGATGMGSIRTKMDAISANIGNSFADAKEARQMSA